jgi:hypothetical protein
VVATLHQLSEVNTPQTGKLGHYRKILHVDATKAACQNLRLTKYYHPPGREQERSCGADSP